MRARRAAVAAMLVFAGWCPGVADAKPGPSPLPEPPQEPKTVMDGDGAYRVGIDIVPGTYSSGGPVSDSACSWRRIRDEETVDNTITKKPQVVLIEPTDTVFKTMRCQPWRQVECPPTCAPSNKPGSVNLPSLILDGLTPHRS